MAAHAQRRRHQHLLQVLAVSIFVIGPSTAFGQQGYDLPPRPDPTISASADPNPPTTVAEEQPPSTEAASAPSSASMSEPIAPGLTSAASSGGFGFPIPPSTSQLPEPEDESPLAGPLEKLKAGYQLDLKQRVGLTGNWFGHRSDLVDKGLIFYADTTQYYLGNTTGGFEQRFDYAGHNDYVLTGIGERLGLWDGFFFRLRGETRFGANADGFGTGTIITPAVGAAIPVPNEQLTALTELFFVQRVGQRLLFQAGKLTTLDGDPLVFAAGRGKRQFFNSSFVFNPIFARTIPYATVGSGFVYLSEELEPLLAFSVLDSDPSPRTSGLQDLYDDVTLTGSVRIPVKPFGLKGHQAFTGSWSSKAFIGFDESPIVPIEGAPIFGRREDSWALGYSFDQYLWQDETDPKRGWGLFGRAGISDGDPNPIFWFWSLGIGGKGPLAIRPEDTFGVGFFNSGARDGTLLDEALQLQDSYGVELFYNISLSGWAKLTPDLQILQGALPNAEPAILFGLRLQTIY